MRRVLAAELAELVVLETPCGGLLVLGRRVVPVLAITALQRNDFSHDSYFTFSNSCGVGANSCTSNLRDEKTSANNILRRRKSSILLPSPKTSLRTCSPSSVLRANSANSA